MSLFILALNFGILTFNLIMKLSAIYMENAKFRRKVRKESDVLALTVSRLFRGRPSRATSECNDFPSKLHLARERALKFALAFPNSNPQEFFDVSERPPSLMTRFRGGKRIDQNQKSSGLLYGGFGVVKNIRNCAASKTVVTSDGNFISSELTRIPFFFGRDVTRDV